MWFVIVVFVRYFFRALWFGLTLMLGSVIAIARGVPSTVRDIADDWILRAIEAGVPTRHAPVIHRTVQVVATIAIIFGWLLLAYLTVFIVGRIF